MIHQLFMYNYRTSELFTNTRIKHKFFRLLSYDDMTDMADSNTKIAG